MSLDKSVESILKSKDYTVKLNQPANTRPPEALYFNQQKSGEVFSLGAPLELED